MDSSLPKRPRLSNESLHISPRVREIVNIELLEDGDQPNQPSSFDYLAKLLINRYNEKTIECEKHRAEKERFEKVNIELKKENDELKNIANQSEEKIQNLIKQMESKNVVIAAKLGAEYARQKAESQLAKESQKRREAETKLREIEYKYSNFLKEMQNYNKFLTARIEKQQDGQVPRVQLQIQQPQSQCSQNESKIPRHRPHPSRPLVTKEISIIDYRTII